VYITVTFLFRAISQMQLRAFDIFVYANITRMIFYSSIHVFRFLHNNILWKRTKINYKNGLFRLPRVNVTKTSNRNDAGKSLQFRRTRSRLFVASLMCKSGASPETLENEHCALQLGVARLRTWKQRWPFHKTLVFGTNKFCCIALNFGVVFQKECQEKANKNKNFLITFKDIRLDDVRLD